MGVLDLIRESGFNLSGANEKQNKSQKVFPLSARPRSHSTTRVLPPLSDKYALKLALNYKR
jgi:hypothetical protein